MPSLNHVTRFGHLFLDGEDQYLFVENLGRGANSEAQLVLHLQTGELRVRKVSLCYLDEKQTKSEDREKVLFHLQTEAAKRGAQPNIGHLYSANDVPAAVQEGDKKLWSRVQYMSFHNGGDVDHLCQEWHKSGQAMPSSLILRLLIQVVSALQFMRSCGVLHADLHDGNVLVSYDHALGGLPQFHIADFGLAERDTLTHPMSSWKDDALLLHMSLNRWLNAGPPTKERDVLREYLLTTVQNILCKLGTTPSDHLPDLGPLLNALQHAPTGPPEPLTASSASDTQDMYAPLYHRTEQDALGAVGVAGPWHLAQVSIDIWTSQLTVVQISSMTYDNMDHSQDSDTETDLGCAELI